MSEREGTPEDFARMLTGQVEHEPEDRHPDVDLPDEPEPSEAEVEPSHDEVVMALLQRNAGRSRRALTDLFGLGEEPSG